MLEHLTVPTLAAGSALVISLILWWLFVEWVFHPRKKASSRKSESPASANHGRSYNKSNHSPTTKTLVNGSDTAKEQASSDPAIENHSNQSNPHHHTDSIGGAAAVAASVNTAPHAGASADGTNAESDKAKNDKTGGAERGLDSQTCAQNETGVAKTTIGEKSPLKTEPLPKAGVDNKPDTKATDLTDATAKQASASIPLQPDTASNGDTNKLHAKPENAQRSPATAPQRNTSHQATTDQKFPMRSGRGQKSPARQAPVKQAQVKQAPVKQAQVRQAHTNQPQVDKATANEDQANRNQVTKAQAKQRQTSQQPQSLSTGDAELAVLPVTEAKADGTQKAPVVNKPLTQTPGAKNASDKVSGKARPGKHHQNHPTNNQVTKDQAANKQTPKYQTAAKAKSPSVRNEALLQIPHLATGTRPNPSDIVNFNEKAKDEKTQSVKNNPGTAKRLQDLSVSVSKTDAQNKSQPNTPPASTTTGNNVTPLAGLTNRHATKQTANRDQSDPGGKSFIEMAMERQSCAPDDADQKKTNHDNTGLRAQLAASERKIASLQSTLNNMQHREFSTRQSASSQSESFEQTQNSAGSRPSLLSKVRVLDPTES